MSFKFNPFISNFDNVGTDGSNPNFLNPVATESVLPTPALDGALCVVTSTNQVYQFDLPLNKWMNVTQKFIDAVGTVPNANGLSVSTSTNVDNVIETHLQLQPADATNPGVVSTTTQSFSGTKTFGSTILTPGIDSDSAGGTIGIGFVNAGVINIGHSGATVNITGTTNNIDVTNYNVLNKTIEMNTGGPAASGSGVGIEVQENSIVTGYTETSGDRASWLMKAPATAGIITFTPGASGFTIDQGSHNPVTISTANGLSLLNQALSLGLSSSSTTGALSSTDWTTFNNKFDLPVFTPNSVIFANGTTLVEDNDGFNYNSTNKTLTIKQPSSVTNGAPVLDVFIDPAGLNHRNAIAMSGNPQEGVRIYRNDLDRGWLELAGGLTNTSGGTLYVNGNNSTGGDAGGIQTTFGLTTSSFDIYDVTQSQKLFSVNNSGQLLSDTGAITTDGSGKINVVNANISSLTASSAIVTDASKNLVSSSVTSTELGYVSGVTSAIQTQLNNLSAYALSIDPVKVAAIENVSNKTLTGASPLVVDGVTLIVGDKVLLNAQSTLTEKGVYTYTESAGIYTLVPLTSPPLAVGFTVFSLGGARYGATTYKVQTYSGGIPTFVIQGFRPFLAPTNIVPYDTSGTLNIGSIASPWNAITGKTVSVINSGLTAGSLSADATNMYLGSSIRNLVLFSNLVAGTVSLITGAQTGSNNSGDIQLSTGSVVSGTRGKVSLDGSYIEVNSKLISNVADPVSAQDAVTKNYVTSVLNNPSDIAPTSFSAADNQASPDNVTGLFFLNGTVRSFKAQVSVSINATMPLYETFELIGVQTGSGWSMSSMSLGDDSGVIFSITGAGQVQYQSTASPGFISNTIKFRATTLTV